MQKKRLVKSKVLMLFPSILMLFLSGCVHRPMGGWDHMMGTGTYGGILMWLLLIIILGVVIYFILNRGEGIGDWKNRERENPTEILKKRYARGEITKEEFEMMKKDIENR